MIVNISTKRQATFSGVSSCFHMFHTTLRPIKAARWVEMIVFTTNNLLHEWCWRNPSLFLAVQICTVIFVCQLVFVSRKNLRVWLVNDTYDETGFPLPPIISGVTCFKKEKRKKKLRYDSLYWPLELREVYSTLFTIHAFIFWFKKQDQQN